MSPMSEGRIRESWLEEIYALDLGNLEDVVNYVSRSIRANSTQGATKQEWKDSQAMCVAEEAGEFIKEYRRLKGFARSPGNREHMLEELADVVISAMVMFENLGEDPNEAIRKKLEVIVTRGYVNKTPEHKVVFRFTMPPYEIAPPQYYGPVKQSCSCGEDLCEEDVNA